MFSGKFAGRILRKSFIDGLVKRAKHLNKVSKKTIVFAETEEHILKACSKLIKEGIATPLIVGDSKQVLHMCQQSGIKNISEKHIISVEEKLDEYAKQYVALRTADGKPIALDEAKSKISKPHYYAAMLLHNGLAEGMISGINSETKPYLPAFEIIKTREGISRASGLFIMEGKSGESKGELFFFADCALNINPTAELLADIALTTADSAINFGIKPRIAMLSFSTRDSAKHEMVDKVKAATKIVKQRDADLIIDGEIQLDAAIVPEVFKKKCPDSILEGKANILIFPDLNSGNIGYKLAQRMAGYTAIGPIMQGLNKPVNDLSRGASVEDIVELAAITVVQSQ